MMLSIIIPVYGVEKYIRHTLQSIFNQRFPQDQVEIIIVNDGTKDNSMAIVDEFSDYKCLSVVNQENSGLSVARNTGLKVAKGQYVWFVDSDDWLMENCIDGILKILKRSNAEVYAFRLTEFDEDGNVLLKRSNPYPDGEQKDGISALLNNEFQYTPMQIYVIKRSFLFENNLFFKERLLHEDVEFAPRMLIAAKLVYFSDLLSYCYLRRQSGSITSNRYLSPQRIDSYFVILKEFDDLCSICSDPLIRTILYRIQKRIVLHLTRSCDGEAFDLLMNREISEQKFGKYGRTVLLKTIFQRGLFREKIRDVFFIISPALYHKVCAI